MEQLGVTAISHGEIVRKTRPALAALSLPAAAEKAIQDALAIRDDNAPVMTDRKGNPEPDPDLRDNENVPLPAISLSFLHDPTDRLNRIEFLGAISEYVRAEVLPYVPDAWVDTDKTKIGYEIPLTRYFYKYVAPRPLEQIDAELRGLEAEIQRLLAEVTG
jgi:type I restriction enzyme M protein